MPLLSQTRDRMLDPVTCLRHNHCDAHLAQKSLRCKIEVCGLRWSGEDVFCSSECIARKTDLFYGYAIRWLTSSRHLAAVAAFKINDVENFVPPTDQPTQQHASSSFECAYKLLVSHHLFVSLNLKGRKHAGSLIRHFLSVSCCTSSLI